MNDFFQKGKRADACIFFISFTLPPLPPWVPTPLPSPSQSSETRPLSKSYRLFTFLFLAPALINVMRL